MNTATQPTQGETKVRAKVNERKFFETMKHMFSTSFSVLGELMQNARRAGASRIEFEVDVEKKTMAIVDDGHGITDFQVVIAMCESGWEEQTMLTDKPFGMGLFSVFFAAKSVVFRSGGRILTVCLDDVINKRELTVKDDPHATQVVSGTRIEFVELDEAFLRHSSAWYHRASKLEGHAVIREIEMRSLGFPIPVVINGIECERPHAQGNLEGNHTTIGFVSFPGVTHADGAIPHPGKRQLYLQGLPIGSSRGVTEPIVVHLDSTQFIALMPDRKDLFNAVEQSRRIDEALQAMVSSHLAAKKAVIPPRDFVRSDWDNCVRHGCLALMDDIPWVPESVLSSVDRVKKDADDVWSFGHERVLIPREAFVDGSVKAWFDAPSSTEVAESAALILKVMQQASIRRITDILPSTHWLCSLQPSVHDLRFDWSVEGEEGEDRIDGDLGTCRIGLAKSATVDVRSTTSDYAMRVGFKDGWVMFPEKPVDGYEETYRMDMDLVCYVLGTETAVDSPIDALSGFIDEYDHYRDEWREEAEHNWHQKVIAMRGTSLAGVIDQVLCDGVRHIGAKQADALCVVAVGGKGEPGGRQNQLRTVVIDLVQEDIWKRMATCMSSGLEEGDLLAMATQLREAFVAATVASVNQLAP